MRPTQPVNPFTGEVVGESRPRQAAEKPKASKSYVNDRAAAREWQAVLDQKAANDREHVYLFLFVLAVILGSIANGGWRARERTPGDSAYYDGLSRAEQYNR